MTISNVYLIFWGPLNLGALCDRTARTCLDTGLILAPGEDRGHVTEVIDGGVDSVAAVEEEADRP